MGAGGDLRARRRRRRRAARPGRAPRRRGSRPPAGPGGRAPRAAAVSSQLLSIPRMTRSPGIAAPRSIAPGARAQVTPARRPRNGGRREEPPWPSPGPCSSPGPQAQSRGLRRGARGAAARPVPAGDRAAARDRAGRRRRSTSPASQGLLFTSANGVEQFAARSRRPRPAGLLRRRDDRRGGAARPGFAARSADGDVGGARRAGRRGAPARRRGVPARARAARRGRPGRAAGGGGRAGARGGDLRPGAAPADRRRRAALLAAGGIGRGRALLAAHRRGSSPPRPRGAGWDLARDRRGLAQRRGGRRRSTARARRARRRRERRRGRHARGAGASRLLRVPPGPSACSARNACA